jgi:hypothetical protein
MSQRLHSLIASALVPANLPYAILGTLMLVSLLSRAILLLR